MNRILNAFSHIINIIFNKCTLGKNSFLLGRVSIDKRVFLSIGNNVRIYNLKVTGTGSIILSDNIEVRDLYIHVGDNGRVEISRDVFIGVSCKFIIYDSLKIGDGTLVSPDVMIIDNNHIRNSELISHSGLDKERITIGSNCWIGAKSIIGKGVDIGDNTTIGAMSFLNKNAEPDSLYVGIPAELKKRNVK